MAIERQIGALVGADEDNLQAVANNATHTGSVVDLLEDNDSVADLWLYAVVTSTVTAGAIEIKINAQRVAGGGYSKPAFEISIPPINGTLKIPLGKRPTPRRLNAEVFNNATGAEASVAILYELERFDAFLDDGEAE